MADFWSQVVDFFTSERLAALIRGLVILVVGLLLSKVLGRMAGRLAARRGSSQQALITKRLVYYVLAVLVVISALHNFGFDLTVLLGAAGILTVAVGFASQTSASNVISGLFLLGERPFVVGDVVQVGGTTGEVISVDLLSVKLRTFDNLLVRVPNENLLKTEITNLTHFPIRRFDLRVGVAYKEDVAWVREVLLQVADEDPLCLDEPKPMILHQGFGDSSVNLQFSVWAARENFLELRNSIPDRVKATFDRLGIEIPFPHRTFYPGSAAQPLQVRVLQGGAEPSSSAPTSLEKPGQF